MRAAVAFSLLLIGLAGAASARTLTVSGQAGVLAEWDLTATVTEQTKSHWAGPLTLKHVGFCSADGPEEKTGELRLIAPEPAGEIAATILIDGDACTFNGRLNDDGFMRCPGRPDVPMLLLLQ